MDENERGTLTKLAWKVLGMVGDSRGKVECIREAGGLLRFHQKTRGKVGTVGNWGKGEAPRGRDTSSSNVDERK